MVVGNPKPGSRTLGAGVHVAGELAGRDPDLVVDLADVGAAVAGLVRRGGAPSRRRGRSRRPRGRGQPDVQGDVHGAAEAVPRPVRRGHRAHRCRRPADARCRPGARPRARALAAPVAHRARRRGPGAGPLRPRLRARPSRGVRRVAGRARPVVRAVLAPPLLEGVS